MKLVLLAWGIVAGVFALWAALATIAPDLFVVKGNPIPGWARSPNLVWVALPAVVAWLVTAFWGLWRRIDKVAAEPQEREQVFQSWLRDREREIAERCEAEYRALSIELNTTRGANESALNAFHKEYAGRLAGIEARIVDGREKAVLDRLIGRGEELLSQAKSIPTEQSVTAPILTKTTLDAVVAWEQDARAWLKKNKPDFEFDFVADFLAPAGADMRETVIRRAATRIERLRGVKASVV